MSALREAVLLPMRLRGFAAKTVDAYILALEPLSYREQFGRFAVELLLFNALLISTLGLRRCSKRSHPFGARRNGAPYTSGKC